MQYMSVDLETEYGLDPYTKKIILIGCATSTGDEYVWDARKEVPPDWFFKRLEDNETDVIMHNASFDTKFLWHSYNSRTRRVYDTMSNEKLLYLGDLRGNKNPQGVLVKLGVVLDRRYGIKLDKGFINKIRFGVVDEDSKVGVLGDVRHLAQVREDQLRELKRLGMLEASDIENKLAFINGIMEYNGMPLDTAMYLDNMKKIFRLRSKAGKMVYSLMGYSYSEDPISGDIFGGFKLSSPKDGPKALRKIGIKVKDYSQDGLQYHLYKEKDPNKRLICQYILEWKKWNGALTKKLDEKINPVTGRIHPSYNSLGADTGRYTSKDPNGQNIATMYKTLELIDGVVKNNYSGIDQRSCFRPKADSGESWVGVDLSQVELRWYGCLAGVRSIIDEYKKGKEADLHRSAAAMVLAINSEDITPEQRSLGKPVNFGVRTFGGGINALMGAALDYGIIIDEKTARDYKQKLLANDAEGVSWGRNVTVEAQRNGYIQFLAGYRRLLPDKRRIIETLCRNTPIQGSAGVVNKLGIISFFDWIEKNKSIKTVRLVGTVHDEVNSIVPTWEAEEVKDAQVKCMQDSGNTHMLPLGIECLAEGGVGECWKKEY